MNIPRCRRKIEMTPAVQSRNDTRAAEPIPQRFGESPIVEDPDLPAPGNVPVNDDPVVTGENTGGALALLRQQMPRPRLPFPTPPTAILSCLVPAMPG